MRPPRTRGAFQIVFPALIASGLLAAWTLPRTPAAEQTVAPRPAAGPLQVHPENPRYFTDGSGRAVYLTGSHTWASLVDIGPKDPPPAFDFGAYLDFLEKYHHNFVRLWTWETVNWNTKGNRQNTLHTATPQPYARTGPGKALDGKPKFDLTKYDPEYFKRLRQRVQAARDRGIYVSISAPVSSPQPLAGKPPGGTRLPFGSRTGPAACACRSRSSGGRRQAGRCTRP
jgi:hypothetical protein